MVWQPVHKVEKALVCEAVYRVLVEQLAAAGGGHDENQGQEEENNSGPHWSLRTSAHRGRETRADAGGGGVAQPKEGVVELAGGDVRRKLWCLHLLAARVTTRRDSAAAFPMMVRTPAAKAGQLRR